MHMARWLCLFFLLVGCSRNEIELADKLTSADKPLSYEEALTIVRSQWPATEYVVNELLPANTDLELEPWTGPLTKLRVGLNWIKNDEVTQLYVGIDHGYFEAVGIELEVIPGGPGRRPLPLLVSGYLDIYIEAAGSQVIWALNSKTPVPLVVLGGVLQQYPYSFITLDRGTPPDQRSEKKLTPEDFVGKKIGLSPGAPDYLRRFFFEQTGLSEEDIEIVAAGATIEPLIAGAYDFYGSWMDNDPRMLEHLGYYNWTYWSFPDHGWSDLSTLVTVLPEMLDEKPDLLRRFLKALTLATIDMSENPEAAADAALNHIEGTTLTKELILKRIRFQIEATRQRTEERPILYIDPDRFNQVAARMYQYGSIDLQATVGQRE